jgi:predicted PurR-regulated permease PerM
MSNESEHITDTAIKLTIAALLAIWCFRIIAPFVGPVAWGLVIAIAATGFYERLLGIVGGRTKPAIALFILTGLSVLIIPSVMLSETLVSGGKGIADQLAQGTLQIPPPPASVEGWPFIGESLYPIWLLASQNLQAAVGQLEPQLKALSKPMLAMAGSAGLGLLQMMLSIVIAAVFLAHYEGTQAFIRRIATRLAGPRGNELATLSSATITSVTVGILGVACIQSLLAGIGFMIAGIPAAGLWALFVLIAAVIQLPVILLMIPIVLYAFTAASTTVATVFAVWCLFVSLVDNVLKPILFAKGGADVPVLVIFLGSIGGMVSSGLIGLFIGPVVLALGYEVAGAWIGGSSDAPAVSED